MTEEEKKIFWELDDEIYLVNKNKTYKKMFKSLIRYDGDNVQNFINKLMSWYFVKYSDKYIELVLNKNNKDIKNDLIKEMSFENLKCRNPEMIFFDDGKDNLYYQYLVVMAGWGIIYNRSSNPGYGLFRVKKMFNDFNSYYNWNLDYRIYESIIDFDYSLDNPTILVLLEQKKIDSLINNKKKNKLSKILNLFRR